MLISISLISIAQISLMCSDWLSVMCGIIEFLRWALCVRWLSIGRCSRLATLKSSITWPTYYRENIYTQSNTGDEWMRRRRRRVMDNRGDEFCDFDKTNECYRRDVNVCCIFASFIIIIINSISRIDVSVRARTPSASIFHLEFQLQIIISKRFYIYYNTSTILRHHHKSVWLLLFDCLANARRRLESALFSSYDDTTLRKDFF